MHRQRGPGASSGAWEAQTAANETPADATEPREREREREGGGGMEGEAEGRGERGRKAPGPPRRRLYMHKTHIPPSTLFAHECVESRRCIRVHPNSPADRGPISIDRQRLRETLPNPWKIHDNYSITSKRSFSILFETSYRVNLCGKRR
jgi:hypothetical protein